MQSENIDKLAKALAKVQGSLEGAKKDSRNPHFKSDYADLRSVWQAVREPLAENDLSVVQLGADAPEGHIGIETTLLHSSGQWISGTMVLPSKKKDDPQQFGSAISYARRYSLASILGVYQEDNDCNEVPKPVPAKQPSKAPAKKETPEQKAKKELWALAMEKNVDNADMAKAYIDGFAQKLDEPAPLSDLNAAQMMIIIRQIKESN